MKVSPVSNSNPQFRGNIMVTCKLNSNIEKGMMKAAEELKLKEKPIDVLVRTTKNGLCELSIISDKNYHKTTIISDAIESEQIGNEAIKTVVRNYEAYKNDKSVSSRILRFFSSIF